MPLGRYIDRVTPPPLVDIPACPRCAGLEQVAREREKELRDLRKRVARYELGATRDQQLRPSEQLP